jgi:hypothetical protein
LIPSATWTAAGTHEPRKVRGIAPASERLIDESESPEIVPDPFTAPDASQANRGAAEWAGGHPRS